jgi:hypothetical protein
LEDLQYLLWYVGVDPHGYSELLMKLGGAAEAARCWATRDEIQVTRHWGCACIVKYNIEASQVRQHLFNQYFVNGNV